MASHHRGLAFERLNYDGEPNEVDKGIVAFMEALCKIESDLLEFETKVSELELDYTGWQATQELEALEANHSKYVTELRDAHRNVVQKHLSQFDRFDSDRQTRSTQRRIHEHRQAFLGMIRHLQEIVDRIGRRIDAKRNSANSRLVLTTSLTAVLISTASFLSQMLF